MYWKFFFSTFMLSDRPMSEQEIQVFDPPDNFFEKENQLKNLRQKIYVKNFFTA